MFTHPRPVNNSKSEAKPTLAIPAVWEYPFLLIKSIRVVRYLTCESRSSRLADGETTSSFGQRVSCLAHWSGQRYGGGDGVVDTSFNSFVYDKLYLVISWILR